MNNIWIITAREYFTRVKKRSFILMTLLTPLLITAFYGVIIWVSIGQSGTVEHQNIVVVDHSGIFKNKIQNLESITFMDREAFTVEKLIENENIDGMVSVPMDFSIDKPLTLKYESMNSLSVNNTVRIESVFREVLRKQKLKNSGVSQNTIDSLQSSVSLTQFTVEQDGSTKSSNVGILTGLGMALAFMIYMFIFLYGVQVMKGVIEEKTNRIVELIVSTVKPFQLMMGKVIGIALVGLTQLSIWITLTIILMGIVGVIVGLNMSDLQHVSEIANNPMLAEMDKGNADMIATALNLPFLKIFGVFVFYFLGGYLFYGALFAAIGSAVDSETDTQQFMLPITLPLVFSFAISFSIVVGDPHGTLATWMSMIPISSPVVMMVRLPFMGIEHTRQILLSMAIMIASIVGVIWLAGKIYRTGILMYGKKPTYKELAKWLFYKN